jgi:hypothetical protein
MLITRRPGSRAGIQALRYRDKRHPRRSNSSSSSPKIPDAARRPDQLSHNNRWKWAHSVWLRKVWWVAGTTCWWPTATDGWDEAWHIPRMTGSMPTSWRGWGAPLWLDPAEHWSSKRGQTWWCCGRGMVSVGWTPRIQYGAVMPGPADGSAGDWVVGQGGRSTLFNPLLTSRKSITSLSLLKAKRRGNRAESHR